MSVEDLIELLSGDVPSGLSGVVKEAVAHLRAFSSAKVVLGEKQSKDELLKIYEGRLRRSQARALQVPGLAETVDSFKHARGMLRGGYAQSDNDLIYFWTDEVGKLAGCVLKAEK